MNKKTSAAKAVFRSSFVPKKAAGFFPIHIGFFTTSSWTNVRHPKQAGKGVSKLNAVTAYQTFHSAPLKDGTVPQ